MTLDALIMLCGTVVALTPFLGFPKSWDDWILLVVGIIIVGLGIVVRRTKNRSQKEEARGRVYVESAPPAHE